MIFIRYISFILIGSFLSLYPPVLNASSLICHGWGPVGSGFESFLIKDFETLGPYKPRTIQTEIYRFLVRETGHGRAGEKLEYVESTITIERLDSTVLSEMNLRFSELSDHATLKAEKAYISCAFRK